ncbi:MAG: transposase [Rhodospirillaceae bacterium]|jgi:putative transposase|nr:transposase [Rhodospirillaceae bacterium]MBT3782567.1 transposase [Rhodospirillaceae bacterium]MBT3975071.1 transposase [Rhodospirillaceae bacterium]MBT4561551.1 transposase [Rhodospirillaceae bacterium]MBT4743187.1 transposase [Rhodospirillaceae bacterium]
MARPLRIEYPGAVYHVTSRGNGGADIALDDGDRADFTALLGEAVARFGWLCHAYCLMDNHYHLLIETPKANLSRGMRQLNGVYTQNHNRRRRRTGHVFQGRFKAILVERDAYLLELARYVVLNPVRAGMVKAAEDWSWSSYRATSGAGPVPGWLSVDWLRGQFGGNDPITAYRAFVAEGLGDRDSPLIEGLGAAVTAGSVLGGDDFVAEAATRVRKAGADASAEFTKAQRHLARPALADLIAAETFGGRGWMVTALRVHGYTLAEIGAEAGLHYATVSRIIKNLAEDGV